MSTTDINIMHDSDDEESRRKEMYENGREESDEEDRNEESDEEDNNEDSDEDSDEEDKNEESDEEDKNEKGVHEIKVKNNEQCMIVSLPKAMYMKIAEDKNITSVLPKVAEFSKNSKSKLCGPSCRHGKQARAAEVVCALPKEMGEDVEKAKQNAKKINGKCKEDCKCTNVEDEKDLKKVKKLYAGILTKKQPNNDKHIGPEFEIDKMQDEQDRKGDYTKSVDVKHMFGDAGRNISHMKELTNGIIKRNGFEWYKPEEMIVQKILHKPGVEPCSRGNMQNAQGQRESAEDIMKHFEISDDYVVIGRKMSVGKDQNNEDLMLYALIIRPLVQNESDPKFVQCYVYAPYPNEPDRKSIMLPAVECPKFWSKNIEKKNANIITEFSQPPSRNVYHLLRTLVYMNKEPTFFDVFDLLDATQAMPRHMRINYKPATSEYCEYKFDREKEEEHNESDEDDMEVQWEVNQNRIKRLWSVILIETSGVLSNQGGNAVKLRKFYENQKSIRKLQFEISTDQSGEVDLKRKMKSIGKKVEEHMDSIKNVIDFDECIDKKKKKGSGKKTDWDRSDNQKQFISSTFFFDIHKECSLSSGYSDKDEYLRMIAVPVIEKCIGMVNSDCDMNGDMNSDCDPVQRRGTKRKMINPSSEQEGRGAHRLDTFYDEVQIADGI